MRREVGRLEVGRREIGRREIGRAGDRQGDGTQETLGGGESGGRVTQGDWKSGDVVRGQQGGPPNHINVGNSRHCRLT